MEFEPSCPVLISEYPHVLMAHGGGGRLSHRLVEKLLLPAFRNPALEARHDGARLELPGGRIAFTTDAYVVQPLFFPGGDIGRLAVYGAVNDLAMCGARPAYLSVSLVLEEGLPMETLWRVACSMGAAAAETGMAIVTGDTKVVERGTGEPGMYVTTSGIGVIEHGLRIEPAGIRPGDVLILSGDLGRHGIAVMLARDDLGLDCAIESDAMPLWEPVFRLLGAGIEVHCLRDLTRGGLASALVELAGAAGVAIEVEETALPVREEVRAACELLGFDPIYVACEGRFAAFVPPGEVSRVLELLPEAGVAGRVTAAPAGRVTMRTSLGTRRVIDMLSGEQLPRIC